MDANKVFSEEDLKKALIALRGGVFIMKTRSMVPAIMPGWEVQVAPITVEGIKIGDIVAFYRDKLICHRLIQRLEEKDGGFLFLEKGDANLISGKLNDEDILGKVVEIRDGTGNLIKASHWKKCKLRNLIFIFIYTKLVMIKRFLWTA